MDEPRAEWNSWFRINDLGEVRIGMKEDKLKVVGTVTDVDPSLLLEGELWIAERWRATDALLRQHGLREKFRLASERDQDFEYGFLWLSFGFSQKARAKRWGPGVSAEDLKDAAMAFKQALEAAQPQGGGQTDYDPSRRRWTFDLELADEQELATFIQVLLGHLDRYPVLAATLGAA